MRIALSGHSALAALRATRAAGIDLATLPRMELPSPDPSPAQRWTRRALCDRAWSFAHRGTLEVVVPSARERIRTKDVSCHVCSAGLPEQSYLDIGNGLAIPCPELLFIEMGQHLSPIAHQLLGMELCGTYSRPGAYQLPAATSVERLSVYSAEVRHVDGVEQARKVTARILDNAWSPMEAVTATLVSLPLYEMGYGLRGLVLNPRTRIAEGSGTRVPDMVIAGTNVGLNYEGEGHLDLDSIVLAATETLLRPQGSDPQRMLDESVARVREKYVDDRRRDRELWQAGLTVFPLTKEDLYQEGAMDGLMLSVYTAIERETGRSMRRQRSFVLDRRFRHERQLRIWSLLPGEVGRRAREELLASLPASAEYCDYLIYDTSPMEIALIGEGVVSLR